MARNFYLSVVEGSETVKGTYLGEELVEKADRPTGNGYYGNVEELKRFLQGKKFLLDCGHRITFNHNLGANLAVLNGRELKIICTLCLY